MRRSLVSVPVLLLLAACATTSSPPPPAPPAVEGPLAGLQFLSGSWRGEGERPGILLEEEWSEPLGTSMTGTFRVLAGGRAVFYELAAIEHAEEGTTLLLRHFGPGLAARGEVLSFRLDRAAEGEASFVATTDDDVRRITYRREGEVLKVTLEREAGAQTVTFQARQRSR